MYVADRGAALSAKPVGAVSAPELPAGDLSLCAAYATGDACRGVTLGGVLGSCTCVNLSEPETALEFKGLFQQATQRPLTPGSAGLTPLDEAVLLAWANAASGLHWPHINHPWRSGYVSVDDLVQQTDGHVYPTGEGLLWLLDAAGCIVEGGAGLAAGPCTAYPRLRSVLERYYAAVLPDPEAGLSVYPPVFVEGNFEEAPPPEPGPLPEPPVKPASSVSWGWLGLGLAAGVAAGVVLWRRP